MPKHIREYGKSPKKKIVCEFIISKSNNWNKYETELYIYKWDYI